MDAEQFEGLVAQAIDAIPEAFQKRIENLVFLVEEWPDPWTLKRMGISNPAAILGFYHGVPLTQRTHDYGFVAPDKISIYRRPILLQCRNDGEVRAMVHHVVRHEVAHYFGIDDDRLWELGAY